MESNQDSDSPYKKSQTGVIKNADQYPPDSDELLKPENIKLESNEVELEAIKQVDGYKEVKYKDAIYMGTFINGKRHGKGVMRYRNGRQYEGYWERDLRDGKGFERYPNGNTYFGHFKKGKANGKGVYTWANGEVYAGEWLLGVK